MEKDLLIQENQKLRKEIMSLNSQFSELTNRMQEITQRFQATSEKCNSLESERNIIKNKFEICLAQIDENKNSYDQGIENLKSIHLKEIQKLQEELNEIIKKQQTKILKSEDIQKNLIQELNSQKNSNSIMEKQNQHILSLASSFFGSKIQNPDELIKILSCSPVEIFPQTNLSPIIDQNAIDFAVSQANQDHKKELYQVVNKMKRKIMKMKTENQILKETYEKKVTENSIVFQERLKELEDKNQELIHDKEKYELSLQNIQNKYDILMKNNASLKIEQEFEISKIKNDLSSPLATLSSQFNAMKQAYIQLDEEKTKSLQKIDFLQNDIKSKNKQISELKAQLIPYQANQPLIENENTQLQKEKNDLLQEQTQYIEQISTLSRTLGEKEDSLKELQVQNEILNNDLKHVQTALEQTTIILNSQKDEISTLTSQRLVFISLLQKANTVFQTITQEQLKKADHLNKLNSIAVQTVAVKELSHFKDIDSEASLIPLAAWSCSLFSPELQSLIEEVAKNKTLKIPSKLRNVMIIISHYFTSQTKQISNDLKAKDHELNNLKDEMNSFLTFFNNVMSSAQKDQKLFFQDIISNPETQKTFSSFIHENRKQMTKLTEESDIIQSQFLELLVLLNSNSFEEAKQAIEQMKTIISKLKSKFQETTSNFNKRISHMKIQNSKFQKQNQEQLITIQTMDQLLKESKNTNELLVKQIKLKDEKIASLSEEHQQIIHEFQLQSQEEIQQLKNHHDEIQNSLMKEQKNNQQLTYSLSKLQDSNTLLQDNYKQAQSIISSLKDQFSKTKKDFEDQKQDINKRREGEVQIVKNHYETLLRVQTKEYQELKNQIDELRQQKQQMDNLISALKKQNNDLTLSAQTIQNHSDTMKDELTREKQLSEAKYKTQIASIEDQLNATIVKCKAKLMEGKMEMIKWICNQLCPSSKEQEISEKSFPIFIQNIRTKYFQLLEMETNLRVILKLGPYQSIEDAISLLLLKE